MRHVRFAMLMCSLAAPALACQQAQQMIGGGDAKSDAKPEAKADAKAPAAPDVAAKDAGKADAGKADDGKKKRGPQLAKGKEVKLEKAPEDVRKAFWAAIQAGRKQTAAKDYDAAIASFDAALQQLPDHPRALSGRGYARLLAGKLDEAEADLRKALAAPGTKKLEGAIAFNLGLVAEKRGDAEVAKAQFALSDALNPSKAAKDKLAGEPACAAEVLYNSPESNVYADWKEVWKALADEGLFDTAAPPADEEAAKRAVCTSDSLKDGETGTFDACAKSPVGPWLVQHYYDFGGHNLAVIEQADAGQWRVSLLGMAGGGRCGCLSDASIDAGAGLVTWKLTEYVPIDVMENDKGEIVDCVDGNDCFSACGEELDATLSTYVFHPTTASPTQVRVPDFYDKPASTTVKVEGTEIVLSGGGCDKRVPIRDPKG